MCKYLYQVIRRHYDRVRQTHYRNCRQTPAPEMIFSLAAAVVEDNFSAVYLRDENGWQRGKQIRVVSGRKDMNDVISRQANRKYSAVRKRREYGANVLDRLQLSQHPWQPWIVRNEID